jgi:hypothetical protein
MVFEGGEEGTALLEEAGRDVRERVRSEKLIVFCRAEVERSGERNSLRFSKSRKSFRSAGALSVSPLLRCTLETV